MVLNPKHQRVDHAALKLTCSQLLQCESVLCSAPKASAVFQLSKLQSTAAQLVMHQPTGCRT